MTGFARADGIADGTSWFWELRSVNGKGLDIRLRLPPHADALEPHIRKILATHLRRGNCTVTLTLRRTTSAGTVRLNSDLLTSLIGVGAQAADIAKASPPSLDTLLQLRGVIESGEGDPADDEINTHQPALLETLTAAARDVAEMRRGEGARLTEVIAGQLTTIEETTAALVAAPARTMEAVRAALMERVDRLIEDRDALDPARLHQEVVLLATKADIEEELARLAAHAAAARDLLDADEPVGRRLDFLCQELNREANTICSKAHHETITQLGLTLKTVIDQLREQVQNIE
ncbi:MAG: YicC/YloC family endoribonuclease [Pseudomonadota bacterium]